jgi:hypothetical protein
LLNILWESTCFISETAKLDDVAGCDATAPRAFHPIQYDLHDHTETPGRSNFQITTEGSSTALALHIGRASVAAVVFLEAITFRKVSKKENASRPA